MVRLSIFSYKQFFIFVIGFMVSGNLLKGQGNCLLYPESSGERKACELSYQAIEYRQGSKESQLLFDKAIKVGPNYAWAYYQKSIPFFKRGLLADGITLINKAIELEPQNYLYYRAYWYFYNRSYNQCISDLEELYTVHQVSYATTPSSELEMRLLLAMAHAFTGNPDKGVRWVENLIEGYEGREHLIGNYDFYVLGLLYYKNNQYDEAQIELEKQITLNSTFADAYYYLGLIKIEKGRNDEAMSHFTHAYELLKGADGGYSLNFFTEFNIDIGDLEEKLSLID